MSKYNLPYTPKTTPTFLPNVPIHSPVPGGVKVYRNMLVERYHETLAKLREKCHQFKNKEIIQMNKELSEINRKIQYIDRENSEGGIKRNHQSTKIKPKKT